MVQLLYRSALNGGKQWNLKGLHAEPAHQGDRCGAKVRATRRDVMADHRNKGVAQWLREKQVSDGELQMIGGRIGTTDFKLDPNAPIECDILQHHVGARRESKPLFQFFR